MFKNILLTVFLFSLLSCGKSSVDELVGNNTAPVVKPNVTLIENYEQIVTLEYDEAFTATSCSLSNLVGLDETTSCSCAAGVCTVGLTPTGTGRGSYTFTVSDGSSSSKSELVVIQTKEIVPFVSTWRVGDGSFGDGSQTVTLPLRSGYNYDFIVDWGDGSTSEITSFNDTDIDHTYGPGTADYTITITGLVEAWYFNSTGDKGKIKSIEELGTVGWKNFEAAFKGCNNLGAVLGGDTSEVQNMSEMFRSAYSVVPDVSSWNTSKVTDMSSMFYDNLAGEPDTKNWDVSKVTTMENMFRNTWNADPNTSSWDVSSVTNMSGMFQDTKNAKPDTSNWDTSNVADMTYMFYSADVANPDTSNWNTSSVTDMRGMFAGTTLANPNTTLWDTSNVTSMWSMFEDSVVADPYINNWDLSSIIDMRYMFRNAGAADPEMSNLDFSEAPNMSQMFQGVTISTANYDALLIQLRDTHTGFSVWSFDVGGSTYTSGGAAEAARTYLQTNRGWSFTDGGSI